MKNLILGLTFLSIIGLYSCSDVSSDTTESSSATATLTEDVGETAQDVYFILSNTSATDYTNSGPSVSSSVSSKSSDTELLSPSSYSDGENQVIMGLPESFNPELTYEVSSTVSRSTTYTIDTTEASYDTVGGETSFYVVNTDDSSEYFETPSTCKKIVTDTDTDGTVITLNIWVDDDEYDDGTNTGDNLITDEMITAMANQFLDSSNDDTYSWVTSIFGDPWGSTANDYSSLFISYDDEIQITILLTDIAHDESTTGGTVGFFHFLNNIESDYDSYYDEDEEEYVYPYGESNERLMFVMDSVLYAHQDEDSDGWETTDYWPQSIFSTLAHEFQHMIHFYQKTVSNRGSGPSFYLSDTWIDEMCSVVAQDLVADKQEVDGPRGVDYDDYTAGSSGNTSGRIPYYNYYGSYTSLTEWGSDLSDYAMVYSFGLYLARNFGGADLFNEIVSNSYYDEQAVVQALSTKNFSNPETNSDYTFAELIENWGVSVLLSDQTDLDIDDQTMTNSGGVFESTEGNYDYNLGSVNFFNYDAGTLSGPGIWGENFVSDYDSYFSTVPPATNVFFLGGENLTGSQSWTITVPEGMTYTMVTKDS